MPAGVLATGPTAQRDLASSQPQVVGVVVGGGQRDRSAALDHWQPGEREVRHDEVGFDGELSLVFTNGLSGHHVTSAGFASLHACGGS